MKKLNQFGNEMKLAIGGLIPLALGLVGVSPAHAQVPDPATLATYAATSTDTGANYVVQSVFTGGVLKYAIFITLLGALIWFVIKAIRRVF